MAGLIFPFILLYYSLPLLKINSISTILFGEWNPDKMIFGIGNFIFTTLIIGIVSTILSLIMGISISLFIDFYRKTLIGRFVHKIIEVMSGIPTVVYGFIGIMFLIPFFRIYTKSPTGYGILSTSIVLSVLILPTIILYINQSMLLIPNSIKLAAKSLGCKKSQYYFQVIFPHILKGIFTASILGFSRAISDTLIALMLSGNSFKFPDSIFSTGRTLTSHIALIMPGEFDSIQFKTVFFIAIILLSFVFLLNLILHKLGNNN